MSILVKKVPSHYSQLIVTTYAILCATIILTPFSVSQISMDQIQALKNPVIWSGVLYLGVVSTAGAFFLWNKGLQMVDAGSGGLYFFFQPMVGTLLGWLFLGEQVGLEYWLGSLLIFPGVLLVIRE